MRRGWRIVVTLALFAVSLAGAGQAQTQPDVDIEPVRVEEPIAPVEGTEVRVNASVSCEGWGEAGEGAYAVYTFDPRDPEHEARFEPAEIELPAGPGECEPGQRSDASTTLILEPTREARAGAGVLTDLELHLEERSDGDVVREHGPWPGPVAYKIGLWAEVEIRPQEEVLELGWDERQSTDVVVAIESNGRAAREVLANSSDSLSVSVRPTTAKVHPDEPDVVHLVVEDVRSAPADERREDVELNVTVRAPWDPYSGPSVATANATVSVHQAPWHETGQALGLGGVLLAGVGFLALVHHQRRHRARPREASPRAIEQAATDWLAALGIVALTWGTGQGPALLAAGALSCLAAAWLATGGRVPQPVAARLARADPDRVGAGLLAAGLAVFGVGLATATSKAMPVLVLLLVAGAWALSQRELPPWASRAVLGVGVLAALAPLLVAGLTIGAGGALARIPVGGPIAPSLGLWVPFGLAFGVLASRSQDLPRAAALIGLVVALAQAWVPGWLLGSRVELGPAIVAGDALLVAMLGASALPGVLALPREET